MNRRLIVRIIQIILAALTAAAVVQELSRPAEDRKWHGKVLFMPYDFRLPTWDRIKDTFWNPYEKRVLIPVIFGLGWTINFYSTFENLGIIHYPAPTEEAFLLPNPRMKGILRTQR